jgi:hypothetical protein
MGLCNTMEHESFEEYARRQEAGKVAKPVIRYDPKLFDRTKRRRAARRRLQSELQAALDAENEKWREVDRNLDKLEYSMTKLERLMKG